MQIHIISQLLQTPITFLSNSFYLLLASCSDFLRCNKFCSSYFTYLNKNVYRQLNHFHQQAPYFLLFMLSISIPIHFHSLSLYLKYLLEVSNNYFNYIHSFHFAPAFYTYQLLFLPNTFSYKNLHNLGYAKYTTVGHVMRKEP